MTESTTPCARRPLAIYYGHHKCASSYINRFLLNLSLDLGLDFISFSDNPAYLYDQSKARSGYDILSLRNAQPHQIAHFPGVPGFHVIRDPRDIVVSAYFSHRKTHRLLSDEMREERDRLNAMDKDDGLVHVMDGITGGTLRDLADWPMNDHGTIMEIKMEEFVVSPYENWTSVFRHLGLLDERAGAFRRGMSCVRRLFNQAWRRAGLPALPLFRMTGTTPGGLAMLNRWVSYKRLSGGRKQGEENENSHYRKGVHGDWVGHFSPKVTAAFKERYPGLVPRLGYAPDDDWGL